MADNLQTKTEKLVKYGNEKFGLNETTLRGILDNATAGKSEDEWQPNPTWWDIEKILAEDTRDYPYKMVLLMVANSLPSSTLDILDATAYATSDGAFYEANGNPVEHTWDLTKDKPCIVDGKEMYKTRYVIVYRNGATASSMQNADVIFAAVNDDTFYAINFLGCVNLEAISGRLFYTQGGYKLLDCYSLKRPPSITQGTITDLTTAFALCYSLEQYPSIDTGTCEKFYSTFQSNKKMKYSPELNTQNGKTFQNMFHGCVNLERSYDYNTSNGTSFDQMYNECTVLKFPPTLDLSKADSVSFMYQNCRGLLIAPGHNLSSATSLAYFLASCISLIETPYYNTLNGTSFSNMCSGCTGLKVFGGANTSKAKDISLMFSSCKNLKEIRGVIDLYSATNASSMLKGCLALENITLKNIKISLYMGLGTGSSNSHYGYLLTLDSLTNAIQELWDNSAGTSTLTLTVGTANLTKLANIYVKLVDITDEMRAEDEYIDNKKPFVVCESTDEGAMLITEYVTSKNWQLA